MKKLLAILFSTILLVACTKSGSEQFIGKWENIRNPNNTMVITENGDHLLIHSVSPLTDTESCFVGRLSDGALLFEYGFGTGSMSIDKSTGLLTDGKAKFKRVSP